MAGKEKRSAYVSRGSSINSRSTIQHLYAIFVVLLLVLMTRGTAKDCYNDLHRLVQENLQWLNQIEVAPRISVSEQDTGIKSFFYELGHTTDLVILMDRSYSVERHYFHLRQKKIIADMLRYHAELQGNFLHIAIVMYDKEAKVVVDGINSDEALTKCDLFEPGGYWDQIQFNTDSSQSEGGGVDAAFREAKNIIKQSSRIGQAMSVVLVVSDGSYASNRYPTTDRAELMGLPYGARIYAMSNGYYAENHEENGLSYLAADNLLNVKELTSEHQYFGTDQEWFTLSRTITPIVEGSLVPYVVVPETDVVDCAARGGTVCDVTAGYYICHDQRSDGPCTCQNGGECVGVTSRSVVCWCPWGYSGRYCEHEDDECQADPPLCSNRGKCVDHVGSFTCDCSSSTGCGCFCEDSCHEYFITPTVPVIGEVIGVDPSPSQTYIWYAIAGAGMALLLVLIIVVATCRKRTIKPRASGIDNTEYYHIDLAHVVPPPNSDDPPMPHAFSSPSVPLPPPPYSQAPPGDDHLSGIACAPARPVLNSKSHLHRMVQSTPEKLNFIEPEVSESQPEDIKMTYM